MVEPVKFKRGDLIFLENETGYRGIHIILKHLNDDRYSIFDVYTKTSKNSFEINRNICSTSYGFDLFDKLEIYRME